MRIDRVRAKSGKVYEYEVFTYYSIRRWTDELNDEFTRWYMNPQNTLTQIGEHFGMTVQYVAIRARMLGIRVNRKPCKTISK